VAEPVGKADGEAAVGAYGGGQQSAALSAAMEELTAFVADDTRTIIAFAPEDLTPVERNEVHTPSMLAVCP
jgi:hypothetical protein